MVDLEREIREDPEGILTSMFPMMESDWCCSMSGLPVPDVDEVDELGVHRITSGELFQRDMLSAIQFQAGHERESVVVDLGGGQVRACLETRYNH